MFHQTIITGQGGHVDYYPSFISLDEASHLWKHLKEQVAWQSHSIKLFGKTYLQPRLIAWMSDEGIDYTYSKTRLISSPWDKHVYRIKAHIEKATNQVFNAVLINYYRDGQDSMGWHADNEKEIHPDSIIASISLGGERFFHLRDLRDKTNKKKIRLQHGSLLTMDRKLQDHWEHQVPKTKKPIQGRINLTFRHIAH